MWSAEDMGVSRGIGISGLDKYAKMFGLGSTTGIALPGEQSGLIPSPAWKAVAFPQSPTWLLGDTYPHRDRAIRFPDHADPGCAIRRRHSERR